MVRAALVYAKRFEFAVFPVHPRGKVPLTKHGCHDATKDPTLILDSWHFNPSANVGIATGKASGIVVLDVDPRHSGDDTLVALENKHGRLPDTPTVLTGGGGRHFYFRAPHGPDVRNSAGTLGPGLDMRGGGGYVIAVPSVHANGNRYSWKPSSRIDEMVTSPLPSWLTDLLVRPLRPAANQTEPWSSGTTDALGSQVDLAELASGICEGQRDDRLFRLACHLRWRGYPREQAEQILVDAAARCRPPFPTRAALRKVDSAWRYAR
jgi:hypothetical protein